MSLLTIVQDILGESGITTISSVVDATDRRAPPLFALAKKSLVEVSHRYEWPHLTRSYTFSTVNGTADYSLPSDFDKLLTDTAYDDTENYQLRGGVTPAQWQYINIYGGLATGKRFRITGYPMKFRLTPTPTAANSLVFLYKTSNHALSAASAEKTTYTDNTDTAIIGDRLIRLELAWRYRRQRGLDYAEEMADAERAIAKAFADSIAAPTIPIGYSSSLPAITDGYVPDRGYGA